MDLFSLLRYKNCQKKQENYFKHKGSWSKIHIGYLIENIRSRSMLTAICVYLGGAWVVIQVVGLFVDIYDIPNQYFNFVVVMFMGGIPTTLTVSWFHGKKGRQAFRKRELLLHLCFLTLTLSTGVCVSKKAIEIPASISFEDKSIAVLPFTNMSDEKTNEYFSDGMTDDILTSLAKIDDLRVISRTSVMKYKKTTKTIKEIANELRVSAILEGSVRKEKDFLRITAQLIDTRTDAHIWAETYDRKVSDVFNIQSEIAHMIASKLKVKLLKDASYYETKSTQNMAAYNFYLKGKYHYYRFNTDGNKNAISFFIKATEFDLGFAKAWASLANAYRRETNFYNGSETLIKKAFESVNQSLRIKPDSPEAYTALGSLYSYKATHEDECYHQKSIEAYEKSLELEPNFTEGLLGLGIEYKQIGRYDQAILTLDRARLRDPTQMIIIEVMMNILMETGKLDRAYEIGKSAWIINPNHKICAKLAHISGYLGNLRIAREWLAKAHAFDPDAREMKANEIMLSLFTELNTLNESRVNELVNKGVNLYPHNRFAFDMAGYFIAVHNETTAKSYFEHSIKINRKYKTDYQTYAPIGLGNILYREKSKEKANSFLSHALLLREKKIKDMYQGYQIPYEISAIYSILGEKEKATDWFKVAVNSGLVNYHIPTVHPWFENIRHEEAFQSSLTLVKKRLNIMKKYVAEKGWEV